MKKRKDKIRLIIIWAVALVMATIAILLGVFLRKEPVVRVINKINLTEVKEQTASTDTGYAFETSYAGADYVPASLFTYPFKKTDSYIMNKDYINMIGEDNALTLSERTVKGIKEILSVNYETIEDETYRQALNEYFDQYIAVTFPDGSITEDVNELSEKLIELIKEDELLIETETYSDKSLVFYDDSSDICRVKAIMVVYSCNNIEALEKFLGVNHITIGEPFSIIYDVYTGADIIMDDRSSFTIKKAEKIA